MEPKDSSKWLHKREGYTATVVFLGCAAKVKDAGDAAWQDAVAYARQDDSESLFIRSRADFLNRFEPIGETEE